jgi:phage tail sheath protein FI
MIYTSIAIFLLFIIVLWLSFQLKKLSDYKNPRKLINKIESYSHTLEDLLTTDKGRKALARLFIKEASFKGFLNDLEKRIINTDNLDDIDRIINEQYINQDTYLKKVQTWIRVHAAGLGNILFSKLNITPGITIKEIPTGIVTIEGASTSVTAFLGPFSDGPMNQATEIRSWRDFESQFGGLDSQSAASYGIRGFFLNGGRRCYVVRIARDAINQPDPEAIIGSPDNRLGLHALENVDVFNLICLPDIFNQAMHEQYTIKTEYRDILSATFRFCEKHRALFILDPPAGINTPENIITFLTNNSFLCHSHGALYFPRIMVSDPFGDLPRVTAPSGSMAGVFARLDETRGVWRAPAGIEAYLNGVTDLEYQLNENEINSLNLNDINSIRFMPNHGHVCWGAHTLLSNHPEWKYINVRRLALFIEESINQGTKWAVFEPNGEQIWSQIRQQVSSFLHTLFREGALAGSQPDQAYYVKCDDQTTSPTDIQNGVLNIEVGIAPINPANFVVLQFTHQKYV